MVLKSVYRVLSSTCRVCHENNRIMSKVDEDAGNEIEYQVEYIGRSRPGTTWRGGWAWMPFVAGGRYGRGVASGSAQRRRHIRLTPLMRWCRGGRAVISSLHVKIQHIPPVFVLTLQPREIPALWSSMRSQRGDWARPTIIVAVNVVGQDHYSIICCHLGAEPGSKGSVAAGPLLQCPPPLLPWQLVDDQ